MVQNHLARYAAPKSWLISRKERHWTARPRPGAHKLSESLTINFILKDLLNQAKTTKEVTYILNNGWICVDKTQRKDYKFSVGFMDTFEITKTGEKFRVLYDKKGRLTLAPISEKETKIKLLKIIGKTLLKKGKIQINLSDGRNILLDKNQANVGDSVLYDLEQKKILQTIPLTKGTLVYLTAGKHIGELATIKEIIRTTGLEKAKLALESGENKFITLMSYALAVGEDKPLISLEVKQ